MKPRYKCRLCNKEVQKPLKHLRLHHQEAYSKLIASGTHFLTDFTHRDGTPAMISWQNKTIPKHPQALKETDCTTHHFVWQDIIFKNRNIHIYIKRTDKRFLDIECKNAVEHLEKIKEEFFLQQDGHKLYKLKADGNQVLLQWSPDVRHIIEMVDAAIEFYEFKHSRTRKIRYLGEDTLKQFSNEEILKLFKHVPAKGPYLHLLYRLHSENFKLIPLLEFIGNTREESFIFRIEKRNKETLIVWENLNPARATYFFRSTKTNNTLPLILSYISEQDQGKRQFLRNEMNRKWAASQLGYLGFADHDNLEDYKYTIGEYIRS